MKKQSLKDIVSSLLVIQCLSLITKMNNYTKHLKLIESLSYKPNLLLHVCCGVCSVYTLDYLRKYFNITIFFTNSNIYPYDEYLNRLNALKEYLTILNDSSIKMIVDEYDNEEYMKDLSIYSNLKEGDIRCKLCYEKRLDKTFRYGKDNNYEYVGTVMSISNRKNAEWLNEIGEKLENKYNITYLYADFKKQDGITKNEKMNKELNLYHQNYCGCIYSIR